MIKELTQEEKEEAINLAMQIDLGNYDPLFLLNCFKKDKKTWTPVLKFWAETNKMTQGVLFRLAAEKMFTY